ncbi:MAG TPA: hypothetical protein VIJ45_05320 [Coriobacteriia bacterium]|jgi:hypothetical protein
MPDNVLRVGPEILTVVLWTVVLFAAALALAVRHRARVVSGSKGHRDPKDEGESEIIGPDGYIDVFANTIEEAGGSLPRMGLIIMISLMIAYFVYLIVYWQPS